LLIIGILVAAIRFSAVRTKGNGSKCNMMRGVHGEAALA
jgi:hypothetical protein